MHINRDYQYPYTGLDGEPVSDAYFENLMGGGDFRNILITAQRGAPDSNLRGHIRLVRSITTIDDERWYRTRSGDYVKGVLLDTPDASGERVLAIPQGANNLWVIGTLTDGDGGRTVHTITSTSTGRSEWRTDVKHYAVIPQGVDIEAVPDDHWTRREYPLVMPHDQSQRVHTWNRLREVQIPAGPGGERYILVTEAQRRQEHVGKVVKIRDTEGRHAVTVGGDYVAGTPVNEPVRRGDLVMVLDSTPRRGPLVGTVSYASTYVEVTTPYDVEAGERVEGTVLAAKWVRLFDEATTTGMDAFRDEPGDSERVRALKSEARALQGRWDAALEAILEESEDRGWERHIEEVAQTAELDLSGVGTRNRQAHVQVNMFVRSDSQGVSPRELRTVADASTDTYAHVRVMGTVVIDVPEGEENFIPTQEMVASAVREKYGALYVADWSHSIVRGGRR